MTVKNNPEIRLCGVGVSEGIGCGGAYIYDEDSSEINPHALAEPSLEMSRYKNALERFAASERQRAADMQSSAGEREASIFLTHAALALDPYADSRIGELINGGMSAEAAVDTLWREWSDLLMSSEDEVTRGRAADGDDVRRGILSELSGGKGTQNIDSIPEGSVLICRRFTPDLAARISNAAIRGVVALTGSKTSHGAILASAMGLPCVMSAPGAEAARQGDTVICDGGSGEVVICPSRDTERKAKDLADKLRARREEEEKFRYVPTVTLDGRRLAVMCNIGTSKEAELAAKSGCEGVGLFRTEFLFVQRSSPPKEEEQFRCYSQAAEALGGLPLTIRVLDIGGDKDIPYLKREKEDNPFLGLRGIRYLLYERELLRGQLRAVLRAAVSGNIRLLIPMVSTLDEIESVRRMWSECAAELKRDGYRVNEDIPVGIMIETPASVLCADTLAEHCDFFSIGTNDLTQYIMAADRGNSRLSSLYDPSQPAVKEAVRLAAAAARRHKKGCHICGRAGEDTALTEFYISCGIEEFSVNMSAVPALRRHISGLGTDK